MIECVPNVSEGRDPAVIDALTAACGPALLDVHHDADHHRAVFTLCGPGTDDAEAAVRALATAVMQHVDLEYHTGVHPRLGALDVVPFVALAGTSSGDAVVAARGFGHWAVRELAAPVFFYGNADEHARTLPSVRASAFRTRQPDLAPRSTRPTRPGVGAIVVGARPPLIAVNCELDRDDLALAQAIAAQVRERDGGLPGVRALGFRMGSRGRVQVSMNLIDLDRTGMQAACEAVRALARGAGAEVATVELVGLLPADELARCDAEFRAWSGLTERDTIEWRLTNGFGASSR